MTHPLFFLIGLFATSAFANWPSGATPFAKAKLEPKSETEVAGMVEFATRGKDLLVWIKVNNILAGDHGIHVHEKGDCGDPKAENAGGHFNPTGEKHGDPTGSHRHIGDFGNFHVEKDSADTVLTIPNRAKKPFDWKYLLGRAVVVHQSKDDLKSQPSGNSGDRVACGVIEKL